MAAKSSDNYLLIRRASGRFGVSDESASNAEHAEEHPVGALFHPSTIDSPRIRWHDTLEAARRDAHSSYSESLASCDIGRLKHPIWGSGELPFDQLHLACDEAVGPLAIESAADIIKSRPEGSTTSFDSAVSTSLPDAR